MNAHTTPDAAAETRPHHKFWPRRLPHALAIPHTSLWFNLEVTATRFPDKPAYLFFGKPLRYRELKAEAESIAGWLQSVGVQAGDRVALFMQNCPQFPTALYAVLRANAVVVPVNPMNRAEEFKHYISDPETKAVICSADLAGVVAAANAALPAAEQLAQVLVTRYTDAMPIGETDPTHAPPPAMAAWLHADPPLPENTAITTFTRWTDALAQARFVGPATAGPDDIALLPYTSGTTGLPKAASTPTGR